MALVDELLALQAPRGPECGVRVALDNLPAGIDRAELEAVIDNPLIQYTTIAKWAAAHDIKLRSEAVSRHRKRECKCRS